MVDEENRRFLFDYDPRGELAPRDIVSRAIYRHQKAGHSVYLDFSNFSEEFFKKRFPTIYHKFRNLGFYVPHDRVPISPAFHFMMGGIKTDVWGRVPGVKYLYAIGEVACTGRGCVWCPCGGLLWMQRRGGNACRVAHLHTWRERGCEWHSAALRAVKEREGVGCCMGTKHTHTHTTTHAPCKARRRRISPR